MAEIIDINDSPLTRARRELDQKDAEIVALRTALENAMNRMASVRAINDMLNLQLSDVITTLTNVQSNFAMIAQNLRTLQSQLPEIK